MDKIKLNSFGILPEINVKEMTVNGVTFLITPRIPYEELLDMIQWCIDRIIGDKPFISAPVKRIIKNFAVIKFYTNIDLGFLDEVHELRDVYENYDLADAYGIIDLIWTEIEPSQRKFFDETLDETLESIEKYRNSTKGIIDTLAESSELDVNTMQRALDFLNDEANNQKIARIMKLAEEG